jgi:SAM-dependent methyltransferase
MAESLFDLSSEYEEMLHRGIRLSGESREFFIAGRLAALRSKLGAGVRVRKILDFGCGIGDTAYRLAEMFPGAGVVGVDNNINALEHAIRTYGSASIRFRPLAELPLERDFDLCYVNGVFHHIEPEERAGALRGIHGALRPGGYLALFENNIWNPGVRMVMKRIPFDRDAKPFSPRHARRLAQQGGFTKPALVWSMFYFPKSLAFLRFTEDFLSRLPLGAQYCVLVAK